MGIQRILFTVSIVLACAMATRAQDARSPVPDAEAQQKALALVREVYGDEYDKAETPARKEDLAKKLLERAGEATDPVNKYALLKVARELSIQGGGPTAFAAAEEMARSFRVDGLEISTEVLAKYGTMAKTPVQNKAVAEKAVELIDRALAADKLALAGQLAKVGLAAAKKARDGPLVKQVAALGGEVEEAAAAYAKVKAALAVLDAKPADPEANLAVGAYSCFRKGDWGKGLSMLALGSDPALKELAIKELKGPSDVTGQVALADGWWNLAETAEGRKKNAMLLRAGAWYQSAAAKLAGLEKAKAQKRLEKIAEIAGPVPPRLGKEITPRGQLARGEWCDVLPWVDVGRDAAAGDWIRKDELVVGRWGHSRLMLPVRLDGSYDLTVEFTPWRDANGVMIGLPVGKTSCRLSVGTAPKLGGRTGLSDVDGQSALDNATTVRGFKLAKGKDYAVDIQVRVEGDGAAIQVVINGKPAVNWAGKQSSLAMPTEWALPQAGRPAIGVNRMIAAFRRAALRPVSGTAVWIRADASKPAAKSEPARK